jgi:hypothetical protein
MMVERVAAADDFAEAQRAHRFFLAALTAGAYTRPLFGST